MRHRIFILAAAAILSTFPALDAAAKSRAISTDQGQGSAEPQAVINLLDQAAPDYTIPAGDTVYVVYLGSRLTPIGNASTPNVPYLVDASGNPIDDPNDFDHDAGDSKGVFLGQIPGADHDVIKLGPTGPVLFCTQAVTSVCSAASQLGDIAKVGTLDASGALPLGSKATANDGTDYPTINFVLTNLDTNKSYSTNYSGVSFANTTISFLGSDSNGAYMNTVVDDTGNPAVPYGLTEDPNLLPEIVSFQDQVFDPNQFDIAGLPDAYNYDAARFEVFFVSPGGGVPEPAVWLTIVAGMGLTGYTLRRRRELASPVA